MQEPETEPTETNHVLEILDGRLCYLKVPATGKTVLVPAEQGRYHHMQLTDLRVARLGKLMALIAPCRDTGGFRILGQFEWPLEQGSSK